MPKRTTEAEIADAILKSLALSATGRATISELVADVPNHVALTPDDRQQSTTRPSEELWEQIVRNIVSHKDSEGNPIAEGLLVSPRKGTLEITPAGRLRVKNKHGI